jgi:hypothetical protein
MEFGLAFTLGLLGSLHCAAMCGPLMLAIPVRASHPLGFLLQRIVYQVGRILTYGLLGIVAGSVGRSFLLLGLQQSLSIALGVVVLLGYFFSARLGLAVPVLRMAGLMRAFLPLQPHQRGFGSSLLLGMLNGLLPCGLVYVAMAAATTQSSIADSIAYMAVFGAGTVPMTLGISLSGHLISLTLRTRMRHALPVGVCLLAALLILRGMALGIPYLSPAGTCCIGH